jgi:hypothetical protein
MTKKQTPNDKPTRTRRKVILENDQRVVAWCDAFIERTEQASGFKPTKDQALKAFLTEVFKAEAFKEFDWARPNDPKPIEQRALEETE